MDNLSNKEVKIRRPCTCLGCGRKMPKGSIVHKVTAVDNGTFSHTNWCEVCDKYWSDYGLGEDDCIMIGDLKENDPEGWEEIRLEVEVNASQETSVIAKPEVDMKKRNDEITKNMLSLVVDNSNEESNQGN